MRREVWIALMVAWVGVLPQPSWAARDDDIDDIRGPVEPGTIRDRRRQRRPSMLSFMVNVPWWYGLGVGVGGRYGFSVAPDGFLPKVNDSFDLEFGADYVFRRWVSINYHAIIIPAEARWTFYFLPNLAAYAKVGLGVEVGFGGVDIFGPYGGGVGTGVVVYHNLFSPGILYKLSDELWLRGELGYWGLKAGLGFTF
jgi:hypothetical protein